ncbi:MAG: glycosyltransferase [Burkholderiales bacterium]|nr:glycosyltransferase [Burkholderiales bacterium]
MISSAHWRAGLRVLRRHLRYAGANPRKLLWIARRGVALAREGALTGVLERHRVEAAQYADYTAWCARYAADGEVEDAAARLAALPASPRVSILLPVYDPPVRFLAAAIASVRAQAYPAWELCIVDDASTHPAVAALLDAQAGDARVRVQRRAVNGGIAAATNDALALATGAFCAFLDHDDTLAPEALLAMVEAIAAHPAAELLFSDEDRQDEDGVRSQPFFKPAWDGEWLRTTNCVLHFMVVRTDLLRALGGLRPGIDGAQDWDLVLRAEERAGRARIVHVPRVLYHWRMIAGSTAAAAYEKPALVAAQRRVLEDTLARRGETAAIGHGTGGWRLRYALPTPAPKVSIVIPTRDRVELLRACVESILAHTAYPDVEIVIVDNDTREPAARAYLAALASTGRARVVAFAHPFNYSALCNVGVHAALGAVIALVNNDIEVRDGDWLRELVSLATRPGIGLAGATLYYPDGTLQHAGVVLGLNGVADRPWIGTPHGYAGPYGRARAVREVSAMITAGAVVLRERYLAVGGMDESLAVSCNDLDLCLRLADHGLRHVISPHAVLVHHESASRGYADDPANAALARDEEARFAARWPGAATDPLYNPNLTSTGRAYDLAWPPRTGVTRRLA